MKIRERLTLDILKCHKPTAALKRLNEWITKKVRSSFYKHGLIVGRHPLYFLIFPVLVAILLSLGALRFKSSPEIRFLFTPTDAPSHDEYDKLMNYLGDEGGLYNLKLFVQAKDSGSLLRETYPEKILSLINFLSNNYSIVDSVDNISMTFSDLQINHKRENEVLITLLEHMVRARELTLQNLHYPVSSWFGEKFYIGNIMSEVKTDPISGLVKDVKTMIFNFRSANGDEQHYEKLKMWTRNFLEPNSIYYDDHLVFSPWNDYLVTAELLKVSKALIPYVGLSFILLIGFAICASLTDSVLTSQPWEAIAGVMTVALAVVSSFGFIFLIGCSFVGTLAVMPVLALALGLDVTFIVLRNWHSTNPELDPVERLAETWADSGTSVIITSLTNVMSNLMGIITNVPAIQIFCLSTTWAVSFLFFYQITFFAAVIAFGSRREKAGRHSFLCCLKVKANLSISGDVLGSSVQSKMSQTSDDKVRRFGSDSLFSKAVSSRFLCFTDQPSSSLSHSILLRNPEVSARILNDDWWHKLSGKIAGLLCNFYSRLAVISCLIIYWITAIWGCMHLDLGLTPEKLFLPESILLQSSKVEGKNLLLEVFVQNPPNFADQSESEQSIVEKYVEKFNVSIYCDDNGNFVTDQLESIPINTLQDVLTTGFCMAVICLLFIPNFFNTLCAKVTILSINVGVFGYLVHWDVNLDPVSMTSLLLSIGNSVDFTSHISFHYYSSPGSDQREKLTTALSFIGLPMIETGFSTVLSVGCLCLVNSYLVWVYFKTTLLVVCLGLIYGLIVLPTFLSWLPMDAWDWIYSEDGRKEKNASSTTDACNNLPYRTPNPDIVQTALDQTAAQKVVTQA